MPDLGSHGSGTITPADEVRTGAAVVRNLRHAGLIIDDPLLTEYLNQLGYNLLAHHEHDQPFPFRFFLVNDPSINAFALPGGFIGINYGLFQKTDSESELASVFAHEIAHVTQKHYARAYDVGTQSSLPILAALIAAIVLGSSGSDVGQAALATAAATQAQKQINFTRHNEEEADRIGINILSQSGFDPQQMASFFDKIERESRLYGVDIPEFLRTHPVSSSRISDARSRARLLPTKTPPDQLNYLIMRNRIESLANPDKQATLNLYQEQLKIRTGNELIATRYGYVLALMRSGKYSQAEKQISILLKSHPTSIAFLLAAAQNQFKANQPKKAIQIYQRALAIYPNNPSILRDYIEVLLKEDQYEQALDELKRFLKTPATDPVFYQFLAQAYAKNRNIAESHEALAEFYYQQGQFHQAVEQINIALKSVKQDFYAISRLEAKRIQIMEETPEELREKQNNLN